MLECLNLLHQYPGRLTHRFIGYHKRMPSLQSFNQSSRFFKSRVNNNSDIQVNNIPLTWLPIKSILSRRKPFKSRYLVQTTSRDKDMAKSAAIPCSSSFGELHCYSIPPCCKSPRTWLEHLFNGIYTNIHGITAWYKFNARSEPCQILVPSNRLKESVCYDRINYVSSACIQLFIPILLGSALALKLFESPTEKALSEEDYDCNQIFIICPNPDDADDIASLEKAQIESDTDASGDSNNSSSDNSESVPNELELEALSCDSSSQQVERANLLWRIILKEYPLLICSILFSVVTSAFEVMIMRISGRLIDVAKQNRRDEFMEIAWKLSQAIVFQGILQFIYYAVLSISMERFKSSLLKFIFEHVIRQDREFFDSHNTSELMNTLTMDVQELNDVIKHSISVGVKNTTSVLGGLIAAFSQNFKLSCFILSAVTASVTIGSMYARILKILGRKFKDASARSSMVASEIMNSVSTVQAFVAESREIDNYNEQVDLATVNAKRFYIALAFFQGISTAGIGGILTAVLLLGGRLITSNVISVGELCSFFVITFNIQHALERISHLMGQIANVKTAWLRIGKIASSLPAINVSSESHLNYPCYTTIENFLGNIHLKNVSFGYATRPDCKVLDHINLHLENGKTLSLVGESGSGKSTIAKLLLRFYDPIDGQITIDGIDIRRVDPYWLRSQIAIVEQEPTLFYGTIMDNIGYGRPGCTSEDIVCAAKLANCDRFIDSFPDGYKTMVGERGAQLSGGQKQRIAIARALLKDPKILILDEATAALDSSSEQLIQEALQRLVKNRTTLIIAHRLSTVKSSDMIIVLDHGSIMEEGNHQSLMVKNGIYASLVKIQMSHPKGDQEDLTRTLQQVL